MSQKLKIFTLRWEVSCDRCNAALCGPYISMCAGCFSIAAEGLRPSDIPFADSRHKICAVCARECTSAELNQVCLACSSKHPDATHANFGRSRESILARCDKCGGLQVPDTGQASRAYRYYRIGRPEPSADPFVCPNRDDAGDTQVQVRCEHAWSLVLTVPPDSGEPLEHDATRLFLTEEHMKDLREGMQSGSSTLWCHKCGALSHTRRSFRTSASYR